LNDPVVKSEVTFQVDNFGDTSALGWLALHFAARAGLDRRARWEFAISVSELATNCVKFARGGRLTLRHVSAPRGCVQIVASDRGPGVADPKRAVEDGWSEGRRLDAVAPRRRGGGLGVGLGAVLRLMDDVSIQTTPEAGTTIVATRWI
jgi:serine/threonine-protein kinase RsbT